MKKIIFIGLLITMFCFSCNVMASETIKVTLDGKLIEFDVPPQIINGRTMVPIRAIFEAMGAKVNWYEPIKAARAEKDDKFVTIKLESEDLWIMPFGQTENQIIKMDCVPILIDGRILVPARYVAEAFNYNVNWNETTKTVVISNNDNYTKSDIQDSNNYSDINGYEFLENLYYDKGPFNVVDNKRNNLYIEEFVISSVEKNEDNTFFITCEITGELYPEDYSNSISYYAFYIDENYKTIGRSLLNVIGKGKFQKIDFLFDCPPQTKRIFISTKDPQFYKYVK